MLNRYTPAVVNFKRLFLALLLFPTDEIFWPHGSHAVLVG